MKQNEINDRSHENHTEWKFFTGTAVSRAMTQFLTCFESRIQYPIVTKVKREKILQDT